MVVGERVVEGQGGAGKDKRSSRATEGRPAKLCNRARLTPEKDSPTNKTSESPSHHHPSLRYPPLFLPDMCVS